MLNRMKEDGAISADEMQRALAAKTVLAAFERPRRDAGLHFVDHLNREAKTFAGVDGLTSASYVVRSTLNAPLQRATESALQEGLARYELSTGRMRFEGAEANLAETIKGSKRRPKRPTAPPRARPNLCGCRRLSGRGCRSTTCIGRPPSSWTRQRRATARSCASASPTAASCRSTPGAPASGAPSTCTTSSASASAREKSTPRGGARAAEKRPRRAAGAARSCRARRSCSRTRAGASSPWRAASPTR